MAGAFDNLVGQADVRRFLSALVESERVSHAYLFVGPEGANKMAAALSLARAIICPNKGADECEACRRVMRRSHPDVHLLAPEGASGYLIDQVRGVVEDVMLAPIQASEKVYVFERAEMLNGASANALLKTLEEPPEHVTLILLALTLESVLPTIASRCQVVGFRSIPPEEAAGILAQNTGLAVERARLALAACDGSIERAGAFCRDNKGFAFRDKVIEALASLREAGAIQILDDSRALVAEADAIVREYEEERRTDREEMSDFLRPAARKALEARDKRALSAKSTEMLHQLVSIARSWIRDLAVIEAGAPELVANFDKLSVLEREAAYTVQARTTQAAAALARCERALAYNVNAQICIDALFFELKEELYDKNRPGEDALQREGAVVRRR